MEYFLLFFCLNFTMSGSGGQWRDEKGEEKEEREDWEKHSGMLCGWSEEGKSWTLVGALEQRYHYLSRTFQPLASNPSLFS